MYFWYTHKTSGFIMSGFKTSETSGLQNVRVTKCQVYKTSGLQKRPVAKKLFFFYFFGGFFIFFPYCIQHCFICRPSDSTVPTDAGIEPRTVATGALAVRHSNHLARSHPLQKNIHIYSLLVVVGNPQVLLQECLQAK